MNKNHPELVVRQAHHDLSEAATFLHDECGICGVFGHSEAARLVYLGLHALQHRGQESAGIVSSNGALTRHVGMGLVSDVFNKENLRPLKGHLAIGHVRYSTAGSSDIRNAQPIVVKIARGTLAIGHNGNLVNAPELRERLERKGAIFQTTADSEIILHLIARSRQPRLEDAIREALSHVRGAYSLLIMTPREMVAVRDPYGVRPLCLGKLRGATVVASETSAFDLLGVKYVRDIEPGELLCVSPEGVHSKKLFHATPLAQCVFEFIYFSRPDSKIFGGHSVYEIRRELGRQLAREAPAQADVVVPVPDSATTAAVGYAEVSKIPYELGLIRSHYIGRTFIEPTQTIRDFGAKIKYNAVPSALHGKRIVLVDDSIVRGTTSRKLVRMLRKAGAKEIHMRISSPPITGPCFYGIDTPTKEELIASSHSVEEIRQYLNVNSLKYLSVDGMLRATRMPRNDFCTACFTGKYRLGTMNGHRSVPQSC